MSKVTLEFLTEQLNLGEQLIAGRNSMFDPQDLPGRYGRVIRELDRVLAAIDCEAVVGGGWAVWRHGYFGRMTQDVDIILPSAQIEEFLRVAAVSGFEAFEQNTGRWPKVLHKETDIMVDLLPEGGRPGTASQPAPTTIPHPSEMGASGTSLRYIQLPALIELKIAAGRGRDESDVIELMRVNRDQTDTIREHLVKVHSDYVTAFDQLVKRAREQQDE